MDKPIRLLMSFLQRWRRDTFLAITYSACNKFFDVLPEALIGVVVDLVVKREESFLSRFGIKTVQDQLYCLGLATFFIWAFESLFQYLYQLKWRGLSQRVEHELRLEAYEHVQKLNLSWFEKHQSGNIISILNEDVNQLERFLDNGLNQIIQIALSTLFIGGIFFYLSPMIALLSLLPVPFIFWSGFFFKREMNQRYLWVREKAGELTAKMNSNLQGIMLIKSFNREKFELSKIEKLSSDYKEANKQAILWSSAYVPLVRLGVLFGFLVTLIYGGLLALRGELNVGAYSALIFLTQRLLWPFTELGVVADNYERSMASTQRIFQLLKTEIVKETDQLAKINRGNILVKNVNFSYESGLPVLKQISLQCEQGKMVALVGNTGSGKSTLAKLLLKLYLYSEGEILLDGVNFNQVSSQSVRQLISYVGQDSYLFHGSIFENVSFGREGATLQEVQAACEKSEIHSFIMSLPLQYDTLVGERGQKLSGGQRQRLCIARALIKNAPIIIFDEATSAVDNETERLIQRAMEEVAREKTTLVIAHRLSTIVNAHRIYVFQEGRIVEEGNHRELLQTQGYYRKLWDIQSGV